MTETILYIDPFSGVSGDMLLGALLSLGVPLEVITSAVEAVIPGEVRFDPVPVKRSGLAGLWCRVEPVGGPPSGTLDEMLELLGRSALDAGIKEHAGRALRSLGDAEAKAHGSAGGPVHLHELGGQDTIADVVGVAAAIAYIGPEQIHCGPINLGRGFVVTSHGTMPVPAPATAHLVEGMPVFAEGPEGELTTPTGAAVLRVLTDVFGVMPSMTVAAVGNGAGTREYKGLPNLLRVFRGQVAGDTMKEAAVMIECGIDDVSPEYLAPAEETLQAAGAREVHLIPVFTKKGRLGILLRVLVGEEDAEDLVREVLEVTGSAGLRFWKVRREVQPRETLTVMTPHGPLSFKRWRLPSGRWRFKPEYDEVRELAGDAGIPEVEMRDLAVASYLSEFGDGQEED
jgi:uncharacterized protein (TIGR00299 family) protein